MKTSLIITTYNRPDALQLVLDSCLSQTVMPDEIIIGDDGSTDATRQMIEKFKNQSVIPVHHVWQEDNGFRAARIRNLSIVKAIHEYLIIIDGDMILHKAFVSTHKTLAQNKTFLQGHRVLLDAILTDKLIKGQRIALNYRTKGLSNKKNSLHNTLLSRLLLREDKSLRTFKSCNFSCWKDDILKVNGFNEDFVGWGKEDTEFAIRMMNAGIKKQDIRFGAVAYHLDHGENSKDVNNPRYIQNLEHLAHTKLHKVISCKNGIKQISKTQ